MTTQAQFEKVQESFDSAVVLGAFRPWGLWHRARKWGRLVPVYHHVNNDMEIGASV